MQGLQHLTHLRAEEKSKTPGLYPKFRLISKVLRMIWTTAEFSKIIGTFSVLSILRSYLRSSELEDEWIVRVVVGGEGEEMNGRRGAGIKDETVQERMTKGDQPNERVGRARLVHQEPAEQDRLDEGVVEDRVRGEHHDVLRQPVSCVTLLQERKTHLHPRHNRLGGLLPRLRHAAQDPDLLLAQRLLARAVKLHKKRLRSESSNQSFGHGESATRRTSVKTTHVPKKTLQPRLPEGGRRNKNEWRRSRHGLNDRTWQVQLKPPPQKRLGSFLVKRPWHETESTNWPLALFPGEENIGKKHGNWDAGSNVPSFSASVHDAQNRPEYLLSVGRG
ncbi:hypothetical protein DFH07DRAFT_941605 [Mycena maculata]|uniref:Uncharacterized protein n=1 Tax=Mycena maculata TaxID=230809 RepID=A0AAD7NA64_9AGAR|nr:hypothetical protein DFH07DRAFT_941605 [Mycena maculata]